MGRLVVPRSTSVTISNKERSTLRAFALGTQEKLAKATSLLSEAVTENERLLATLGVEMKREKEEGEVVGDADEEIDFEMGGDGACFVFDVVLVF